MHDGEFRPVVVAPTFNNAATLGDILKRIAVQGLPVIAVDDGSSDGTAALLAKMVAGGAATPLTVVTHEENRGKAAALRSGFRKSMEMGFTHAVTIDTDGQLAPEEIPVLLNVARARPRALVVGWRDDTAAGYPAKSRIGRRGSNLFVRLESGLRIGDSQCGFRVYPLGLIATVPCRVGRYAFETEILTRATWAGCEIVEAPVTCRYLPAGERVSHYRPLIDTLRGLRMHGFLLWRAFCPWPRHPRWPGDEAKSESVGRESIWRRFWNWVSPARAWRQLREGHVARSEISAGLAVGVFIANLPVPGLQSVLSLYAARRLHLHPLAVLLGSHVSTPPVGLMLWMAGIGLGHFVFHGAWPVLADFDPLRAAWWQANAGPLLLEWLIGGVVLGFFLAVGTFVLTNFLMRGLGEQDDAEGVARA